MVPDLFMDNIIDIAYKFVWSGKKDKIKSRTIIANYRNGELKMLDLKTFIIAQRTMWVKILAKPKQASWKAYPEYILQAIIGMESFKTQIDTKSNKNNITPFYWTILKSWNILHDINKENIEIPNIKRQWLWMNKYIKINKKEIKWNLWNTKGIKIINDILDIDGKFLTINELKQKYNFQCDFLKYNSLKDAIPKEWREKFKKAERQDYPISADDPPGIEIRNKLVPMTKITNKMIYWELIEKIRITAITKDKWIQEFNLNSDTWESIFEIPKIIRDTKIRTFQYKLLFNLIPCNLYLYKIGRSDTYVCHRCDAVDNISHFFYSCPDTRQFWSSFQNWWNLMEDETIIVTKEMAMVGITDPVQNIDNLNACLLLARWYIYTEKLNDKTTFFYNFLCRLKFKIKIEKLICHNNYQMLQYIKRWQKIEEYIE
jgi:hypothetical protein